MRAAPLLPPATITDVYYPETDDMAENTLQHLIAEFLRPLLQRFLQQVWDSSLASLAQSDAVLAPFGALKAQGPFFTGADQFWYYEKDNNRAQVSPDVYVIGNQPPVQTPSSWFLWMLNAAPLFAFEVASDNFEKDYDTAPVQYAPTGVRELLVYDPAAVVEGGARRGRQRFRWQKWCRDEAGALVQAGQTNDDRVKSDALCCWLREVGEGPERLIRIGLGVDGDVLFQSATEEALVAKEQALSDAAREREMREALEERLRTLLKQIELGRAPNDSTTGDKDDKNE